MATVELQVGFIPRYKCNFYTKQCTVTCLSQLVSLFYILRETQGFLKETLQVFKTPLLINAKSHTLTDIHSCSGMYSKVHGYYHNTMSGSCLHTSKLAMLQITNSQGHWHHNCARNFTDTQQLKSYSAIRTVANCLFSRKLPQVRFTSVEGKHSAT